MSCSTIQSYMNQLDFPNQIEISYLPDTYACIVILMSLMLQICFVSDGSQGVILGPLLFSQAHLVSQSVETVGGTRDDGQGQNT
jgi:hypothetical protein